MNYTREFVNWTTEADDRLQISYIESYGETVEELIENAQISLTDWNGNAGPDITLDDLSDDEIETVTQLFEDFIENAH